VLRVFPGVLIQRIPAAGVPAEPHEADLAAVMAPEAVEPGGVVEAFGSQPSMAAAAEIGETGLEAAADSSAAATEAGAASLGGKRGRRRRSAATPRRGSASPKAASTRPRARKKTPA
jgi:hypothetical protein